MHRIATEGDAVQFGFVDEFHTNRLRFLDEKMIYIRTIPMGIGNAVMRAGGDQQFIVTPPGIALPGSIEFVMVKRKSALKTASDFRVSILPCTPLGEREQEIEMVLARQVPQKQVRQGRR